MSEDISSNNPMKEFAFALGGVGLFLAIVLLIGISGFLRPAGEHIKAEAPVATETTEAAAPAAEEGAGATDTAASATAADATATPAPTEASGDVVAAEAGTATAEGTVNQAAVEASEPAAAEANAESGTPGSVAK